MEHRAAVDARMSVYREFAPCPELRDYVRALAWYGPADEGTGPRAPAREFYIGGDSELTPSFADAHTSLLFPLGVSYGKKGWQPCFTTEQIVMGAMTRATKPPTAERLAMVGVYLRPRGAATLLGLPAREITDRTLAMSDAWKRFTMAPEQTSLQAVEGLLACRLRAASPPNRAIWIADLASHVHRRGGRVTVSQMADLTGLSRQHLGRLFLEYLGISPKLFARLTRFRTALRHLGDRERAGGWSGFAEYLGYSDQSHLIADFREFTTFTPQQLARGDRFHPFICDDGSQVRGEQTS